MMSSNVALLHSNNCCVVLEPAICEDLDLHVAIFKVALLHHQESYFAHTYFQKDGIFMVFQIIFFIF